MENLSREQCVCLAKFAKEAKNYEDMVTFMKKVVQICPNLTDEERNLLLEAYYKLIESTFTEVKCISDGNNDKEMLLAKFYRSKLHTKMNMICSDILEMLKTNLLPSAFDAPSKEFYSYMDNCFQGYLNQLNHIHQAVAVEDTMDAQNDSIDFGSSTLSSLISSSNKRLAVVDDADLGTNKRLRTNSFSTAITKLSEAINIFCRERDMNQRSPTLASYDPVDLKGYTHESRYTISPEFRHGFLSLDINLKKDLIAAAGFMDSVPIFNNDTKRLVSVLNGHLTKVNSVKFATEGDFIVTGSLDKTVRVWRELQVGIYKCVTVLRKHTAEVKAVAIRPTNASFVSVSRDNTLCYYDVGSEQCQYRGQVAGTVGSEGYTSVAFHPGGHLFGTGNSEAIVKIWDTNTMKSIADLAGNVGPVTALSFSDNGYHLATAARDGFKLWDMRQSRNSFKKMNPFEQIWNHEAVEFDQSGRYLAIGSSAIGIYDVASDESNPIIKISHVPGTGPATCIKFGPNARYIAVGTMDRDLRIFGPPPL